MSARAELFSPWRICSESASARWRTPAFTCNKCVEICPFDAIKPDFTTRVTDCTLCQTCGGVCPTHAIKFVERWNDVVAEDSRTTRPPGETALGRRGFNLRCWPAESPPQRAERRAAGRDDPILRSRPRDNPDAFLPVRPHRAACPSGSFSRCAYAAGSVIKACPNNVLQSEGFEQGLEGLWTPLVNADWAGCESSCNACGQVCPTGAIRRASRSRKRKVARMGFALVNEQTCLPFANREACQLCVDECVAAGYDAIEFTQVHTRTDDQGLPDSPERDFVAPVVRGGQVRRLRALSDPLPRHQSSPKRNC